MTFVRSAKTERREMFTTELPLSMIDAVVVRALEEDLGAGDVTMIGPEVLLVLGHGEA